VPSPAEKMRRANSIYAGPAGSNLGPGRMLNDGTIDLLPQSLQAPNPLANSPQIYSTPGLERGRSLKADVNNANGGIGVTYSNVMLGGVSTVGDAGPRVPPTTYQNHYLPDGSFAP
jgi:hypothetical protein